MAPDRTRRPHAPPQDWTPVAFKGAAGSGGGEMALGIGI